jgi:hypothetical protein
LGQPGGALGLLGLEVRLAHAFRGRPDTLG